MIVSIIAAVAENRAIGYNNQLIYHISDDLKRFKKLTTGHTVIMGRNTYESLPNGALPNRRNIVISSTLNELPDAEIYNSLDAALDSCGNEDEVFIIGGARLYKEALEKANRLYLTEIHNTPENADVFFPEIPMTFDVVYAECYHDDKLNVDYDFVDYEKI